MSATLPEAIRKALPAGPPPAGLSPDEQHAWDQLTDFYTHGLGYAIEMNQRPQTLYGVADSRSASRRGCSTTTSKATT